MATWCKMQELSKLYQKEAIIPYSHLVLSITAVIDQSNTLYSEVVLRPNIMHLVLQSYYRCSPSCHASENSYKQHFLELLITLLRKNAQALFLL